MIQLLNDSIEDRYHRPNDNWIDVPVQTITEDGHLRTITVRRRSLRKKRQIFTLSCTAFTLGLLMILMSSPYANEFLVPGQLSSSHGQILAGQGADRCAACHGAADGSLGSWISSTLSIGKAQGLTQSELCMKCHDQTFAKSNSLNPHNIDPTELAKRTNKHQSVSFDAGMAFHPPIHGNEIACSACHREHHGFDHDLKAMTDNQCQSCHKSSFHSFATDHPELVSYPLKRRSRIAFDHSSHASLHFPGKQTEFNCNQCHVDDSAKNVKQTASFEQACASCHNQQILDAGEQGLALFALPMIDVVAIEDAKHKIGSWPLAATGDFDGDVPPLMRVLLSADAKAGVILGRYPVDFSFSDIDPDEPSQVADAVELVWAIKRLMYDLALNGPSAIQGRMESVLKIEVAEQELESMLANLDEQVFQIAVQRWLPDLNAEVAANRFDKPTRAVDKQPNAMANSSISNSKVIQSKRSWWPAEEELLLHVAAMDDQLAANPLKGLISPNQDLIDSSHASPTVIPKPIGTQDKPAAKVVDDQIQNDVLNKQRLNRQSPQATSSNLALGLVEHGNRTADDPELLAANPLKLSNTGINVSDSSPTANHPIINSPKDPVPNEATANAPLADQKISPVMIPSQWTRNDNTFQISYQPSGHADRGLKSWFDLVARVSDSNTRPETKDLFDKMLSMTGIGSCSTCHSVDQLSDQSFAVNWKSEYRDTSVRSFTRFSHAAHLIQPQLQDCSHCHQLDPASRNADSFLGVNSTMNVSNFSPIMKSNCTSCHQPKQAGSGCTQCHNYHIGSRITGLK